MRALCVFSGGLDSMLAAELTRAQGVDVLALFFETPFFASPKAKTSAKSIQLPFKVVDITQRHLEVVRHPKHGYGGNMNPCIDCHALMFRIAGEMLEQEEGSFVITGEVLGQRPMSQNRKSLALIAIESGLEGLLLRPLSAKLLPVTIPERRGWVKRELLMDFQGRSRKPQMTLAARLNINEYPSPAGGCLLTEKAFSRRLRDLFRFSAEPETREIELLKLGRHFRISSDTKLIVGRNKKENEAIQALSAEKDLLMTSMSVP
jgi:tRNA-specific 2-thiouridylase